MKLRLGCVVLASGASRRMGSPKALLRVPGAARKPENGPKADDPPTERFAERIVAAARTIGADPIVLVLGPPDGSSIAATLSHDCEFAWNPDPERGMLTSIQAGVAALPVECDAVLVWPVDLPLVNIATVIAIAEAEPFDEIIVPRCRDRGGHPVRIPARYFDRLHALPGDEGLRGLMRAHSPRRLDVDDPGIYQDVDTPEDYARLIPA